MSSESSNVYFFLPSTAGCSEGFSRYLSSVNLLPIDIGENSFETEDTISFDTSKLDNLCLAENFFETENPLSFEPSKLDKVCPEKKVMTEAVVKMLKK